MKKTLLTCLAIVAVLAIASSASAITCTIDQRPAATLLVPYFQVSFDADGNLVSTGPGARDTIVTIGNASSAPMIAHVNVYDRESVLVLDFNVALTGFDIQAMRISDIITGHLPNTPLDIDGIPLGDVCQRAGGAVYPNPGGFLRVSPTCPTCVPATPQDNILATTEYDQVFFSVADSLREDCFGFLEDLAIGYIVIDHANYCNLSDPTLPNYYYNNAIGNENNLFGEIIFTSGEGLPTYALSTVNIEADALIGQISLNDPFLTRTFYARYWALAPYPVNNCPNCGSGNPNTDLSLSSPWNIPGGGQFLGIGDQREPLGLRWAARWFDLGLSITSNFRAWRGPGDITVGNCDEPAPQMATTFFDEDEQITLSGVCPSPCTQEQFNFPFETQQENILFFVGAFPAAPAGWVTFDFATGDVLDQAWVDYSFEGEIAFETVLIPGTQLDPSTCNPLILGGAVAFVPPVVPFSPSGVGPGGGGAP